MRKVPSPHPLGRPINHFQHRVSLPAAVFARKPEGKEVAFVHSSLCQPPYPRASRSAQYTTGNDRRRTPTRKLPGGSGKYRVDYHSLVNCQSMSQDSGIEKQLKQRLLHRRNPFRRDDLSHHVPIPAPADATIRLKPSTCESRRSWGEGPRPKRSQGWAEKGV